LIWRNSQGMGLSKAAHYQEFFYADGLAEKAFFLFSKSQDTKQLLSRILSGSIDYRNFKRDIKQNLMSSIWQILRNWTSGQGKAILQIIRLYKQQKHR